MSLPDVSPSLNQLTLDLLQPLAKEVGVDLLGNYRRLKAVVARHLGHQLTEDDKLPPRLLLPAIQETAFAEDPLFAEYFGGLLASALGNRDDDRAVKYIKMIGSMSTYELRTHYIVYGILKRLYNGVEYETYGQSAYIDLGPFLEAACIPTDNPGVVESILVDVFAGLRDSNLIGSTAFESSRFYVTGSPLGELLYMRCHGFFNVQATLYSPGIYIDNCRYLAIDTGYCYRNGDDLTCKWPRHSEV